MAGVNEVFVVQDSNGDTDLHRGFRNGISFENVSQRLLKDRSILRVRNKKGRTVFHEAAKYSNLGIRVFKLLLNSGANLFSVDNAGSSVLHDVIKNRYVSLEMIDYFLKQGLFPDLNDFSGFPPLAYVPQSNLSEEDINKLEVKLIQHIVLPKFKYHRFSVADGNYPTIDPTEMMPLNFCVNEQLRTKYINIINSSVRDILRMGNIIVAHNRSIFQYLLAYCSMTPFVLDDFEVNALSQFYHANSYPAFKDMMSSMLMDAQNQR